ncbi:hypothetical protein JCM11251_006704 [Rhodosporidiobolus azoricus]
MLYRNWERFTEACEGLARASGTKVRSCLRWRHEAGLLVIRITDDHQTLTFKARSAVFLNRFEVLNKKLLAAHQSRRPRTIQPSPASRTTIPDANSPPVALQTDSAAPEPTADVATKGKKKKSKKKAVK